MANRGQARSSRRPVRSGEKCGLPLLLGVLLFLTACAHRQDAAFVPADASIAPVHELVDTPFFPQRRYQCGPAALATLLTGQGVDTSPDRLQALVYIPDQKGSLQAEMLTAPARFGLLGVRLPPQPDSLLTEISAGRPVLVLQNLGKRYLPVWHYAVVIGYNIEKKDIYLRSGADRRRVYRISEFLESWRKSGSWAMVVVAPERIPVSVEAADFLRAASVLERLGDFSNAQTAYQAATQRWPGSVPAWGGVGNMAFALGDFSAAEQAYRTALAVDPDSILIMNNLAMALSRQGCRARALAVIDCARARQDVPLLHKTRSEIGAVPGRQDACGDFTCPAVAR